MHFWLMKTEPSTFGIEHLKQKPNQTDHWDGVRNYQVRNMMRDDFKLHDQALLYHSSCKSPGIVGVVEVCREAYPDFTAFDPSSKYFDPKSTPQTPTWYMVDVQLKREFPALITLAALRQQPGLEKLAILKKGNRLSITPVTETEWQIILDMI